MTAGETHASNAPPAPVTPPAAGPSTAERAARGGIWTMIGYGGGQVVRFATSLVVTRLLFDADRAYGLVGLAWSVIQGLSLFSDLGIVTSLVQNRRGAERSFRSTAFTVQVVRNVLITLLAVAAAPVVEVVYPEYAGSAALIAVAALTCLFSGLESTSLGVLSREMQVRRLAVLNLGIQTLSSATTIVWALLDPSPWALVWGAVLGGAVRAVVSHVWEADRFGWDPSAWRELYSFGKWVFVSTALTFFVTQADKFVFASLIPPEMLGVYAIALQIAMVLPEISGRLTGGVLFPAYCRVVNAGEPLAASFHRYRRPIVLVSGYGIALCCAGGTAGVDLLYRDEFADAGWILQYLAIGGWFGYALQGTHGSALLAVGRPKLVTYTSIAKLAGMLVLIPIGYRLAGFAGAVGAYAATDVLRYATMVACSRAVGVRALADDLRWTAWFGVTAVAGWFVQHLAEQAGARPLSRCFVAGAVVTLAWAPLLVPAVREIRARLRR